MRSLLPRLLVVTILLLPWQWLWAAGCDLPSAERPGVERAVVRSVIDGDTVRLQDDRLVRFVAINTPEMHYDTGQAEPLAREARDFLRKLLGGGSSAILLQTDTKTRDRYGRLLAHVFTPDGKNIQVQLLRRGLGMWVVVPPNLRYLECYRDAEQGARRGKAGVWSAQFKQPRNARSLTIKDGGFQWIRGKITRIGTGKTSLWLNIGDTATLRVRNDDLHYFDHQPLTALKGKVVTVRGWMHPYKQQIVMPLRHPASLEWQEPGP